MNIKKVPRYECPICGMVYETEEEAASCNSGFIPQIGDVLMVNGTPKIVNVCNDLEELESGFLHLDAFEDYMLARFGGKYPFKLKGDSASIAYPSWKKLFCRTKYGQQQAQVATTEEMDSIIKQCQERIKAAERVKKRIVAMNERHGWSEQLIKAIK